MKRILVVKIESMYNALGIFQDRLVYYWRKMGLEVEVLEQTSLESLVERCWDQDDLVFSMNGGMIDLFCNDEGCFLTEVIPIPFYSYYVDHPLHMHQRLRFLPSQYCLFTDPSFKTCAKEHYTLFHDAEVVMQAGIEGSYSQKPFEQREFPVVFCGSYRNSSQVMETINHYDRSMRIFMHSMIEEGMKAPTFTIEQIFDKTLEKFQLPLDREEYAEFLAECKWVELYFRTFFREEVISQIVDAGIPVEIYGDGWEQLNCTRKDLLHCHKPVDYQEMLDIFANARLVINVMPWVKAGFHDRAACAMLNGAMVISDETSYMKEVNAEEEKFALYRLDALAELPGKIAYYLEHPDRTKEIAQNGYIWAKKYHTWENRAIQLSKIFEKDS